MQIKQGNKIFSCHPNLELSPFSLSLQYLCFKKKKKKKRAPTRSKKVVYKRMKHCVFLFFLQCIFFLLISFLFPFYFSPYLHRPLVFPLPFVTIKGQMSQGGGRREREKHAETKKHIPPHKFQMA